MNFAPAFVIPNFNHGATIGATVDKIAPYGLPIFIVDDGSDLATQATLAKLAADQPLIRLSRLAENGVAIALCHSIWQLYCKMR